MSTERLIGQGRDFQGNLVVASLAVLAGNTGV